MHCQGCIGPGTTWANEMNQEVGTYWEVNDKTSVRLAEIEPLLLPVQSFFV